MILALVTLCVIAVIGLGAIMAFSRWPGEPRVPESAKGYLPADHRYEEER